MNIGTIMSRNPRTCSPNDSLAVAASALWEGDCGVVPVTDPDQKSKLVGMLTDRDICMSALFTGRTLNQLSVADAMATKVLTLKPSDGIDHAAALFREGKVRRLPVLDATGIVVGVVSVADLARLSAEGRTGDGLSATEVVNTMAAICKPPGLVPIAVKVADQKSAVAPAEKSTRK